jgi:hypothetical protein
MRKGRNSEEGGGRREEGQTKEGRGHREEEHKRSKTVEERAGAEANNYRCHEFWEEEERGTQAN